MVVCESVPTSESGYATSKVPVLAPTFIFSFLVHTVCARYSRLTWWQMPVPGGTTEKFENAFWPHFRNS
jgi:hypothetical protein